jgi:hypothetical protein
LPRNGNSKTRLADIYLLGKLEKLDEQQQARLQKAEQLLQAYSRYSFAV